ncbi:hypothetical protein KAS14_03135 [Candidatus Bathyarchaeota archaeon]|nr:hypothetical protein [Candidatus Bathyarchaeota archaeon]
MKQSINDPLVKILIKNNTLTEKQLETFLIDVLSDNLAGKALKNEEKARFRLLDGGVSRGAFNRTLKQARNNVIKSIYTLLLLGYLGVFESTSLVPYIEISNKLQNYITTYRDVRKRNERKGEQLRMLNILSKELEINLEQLSKTKNIKNRT